MQEIRLPVPIVVALALLSVPVAAHTTSGGLRAGAAKVDITPQESELSSSSDILRDHQFVRAIMVDDGASCAVLVGIETGPTPNEMVDGAISRASAATGCPASHFIIASVNCHSCNTGGVLGGTPTQDTIVEAIVSAAATAQTTLAPARIGYGTAKVDLNVNRDLFNDRQEWRQSPNPDGPSDKTMAVVEFLGSDYVPIGVFMNYAMHPINFFMTGVLSSDFPGEASRYVEDYFDDRTVAIFTQGALGDQNPMFQQPISTALRTEKGPFRETIGAPPTPPTSPSANPERRAAAGMRAVKPIPPE